MSGPHLVIVGCGDIGARVGLKLHTQGWSISALRRSTSALPSQFQGYAIDYTDPNALASLAYLCPDYVLFTPLPQGRDTAGYQRGFRDPLAVLGTIGWLQSNVGVVMVSSTRVFAERDGGWVTETSPLTTEDAAAVAIQQGEDIALSAPCHSTILRASGLYGELPGMLVERVRSGAFSSDPDRISNRIHREDLAAIAAEVLSKMAAGITTPPILIASDNEPSPIGEVERWLAEHLGMGEALLHTKSLEPQVSVTGLVTPQRGNRRCNNRLLHEMGLQLQYPSYREGYRAMLGEFTGD